MRIKIESPISKKCIIILFPIALLGSACTKDLIFSDELMNMYNGDELLKISYQVERTEYREYHHDSSPLAISRSVPAIHKERFDLKLNQAGEVETFLEVLTPSQSFEINESLPSTSKTVKFIQYKNGKLKNFDNNRSLIGEAEVPALQEGYARLFSSLSERSSHGEALQAQLSGGMLWSNHGEGAASRPPQGQTNGRVNISSLQNPYDERDDFEVIRNSYTADDGKPYTTELIIHKTSNTVRFMSDYDFNQKAVSRVFFTYDSVEGKPQLKATHEEHLIQDEYSGSAKQIIISNYDFYHINLNL